MSQIKISQADLNISVIAGNIVSSAVQATRHLFCPFCADCFLFEFTLKNHLKKEHSRLLQKHCKTFCFESATDSANSLPTIEHQFDKVCSFCGAIFLYNGLLPKHIINYHGALCFTVWEQQQQKDTIKLLPGEKLSIDNYIDSASKEPTILYAECSPGISDIFDKISTDDHDSIDLTIDRTPLKGILKKSAMKSARIICSPSSSCIRRTKNTTLVRSSSSARRMLQFDISGSPSPKKNESLIKTKPKNNNNENENFENNHKSVGRTIRKILFGRCASNLRRKKSPRKKIITSTPINFLDEQDYSQECNAYIKISNRNWKSTLQKQKNRPLFSLLERFQCAHCKQSWENNADLLTHLNEKHKHVRRWFQADYRCGMCSAKFFSNRFLVRHCHLHHTPVQRRNEQKN